MISPARISSHSQAALTQGIKHQQIAASLAQLPLEASQTAPNLIYQQLTKLALSLATKPNHLGPDLPHLISHEAKTRYFPTLQTVNLKTVDDVNLKGYWIPAKNPSSSTVILFHGFYAHSGSMVPLAVKLLERNHSVFMVDFRSHGQSGEEKPCTLGFDEGKDILAAVRHVTSAYPGSSKDLTLLGHSMGASALLMLPKSLEQVPEGIHDIERSVNRFVLDAPYERLELTQNPFITRFFQLKWINQLFPGWRNSFVDMLNGTELKNRMNFPTVLDEFRPAQDFLTSKELMQKPVLLLHGKRDSRTPYEQSVRMQQQLRNNKVDVHFVTLNADHVDPNWNGTDTWIKKRVALRDEETYLKALDEHFKKNPREPSDNGKQNSLPS